MATVYDLVIIGGGLTGCLTAISASKRGYKTIIVEKKTFLGDAITSGLMTGYHEDCKEDIIDKTEVAENALFKKMLLDSLTSYGVKVLFMSDISGVAICGEYAVGAVISNRFGQQLILAKSIIDTSGFDSVVEMVDGVDTWFYNGRYSYCLKYSGETLPPDSCYRVPEELNVVNNSVSVSNSGDGSVFVKFLADVKSGCNRYSDLLEWNFRAVKLSKAIDEILNHDKVFEDLRIIQSSYEVSLVDMPKKVVSSRRCVNIKSIYFPFTSVDGFSKGDIDCCINFVSSELDRILLYKGNISFDDIILKNRDIKIPLADCQISDFNDHKMEVDLLSVKYDYEKYLPVIDSAEVLVVGGGTGGVSSALAATEECGNVVIVDENNGFGGTQTFGSVCRYYHGYNNGFALSQEQKIVKSSPVYKRFLYDFQVDECNIKRYTGVPVCDSICDGSQINGVVIANSEIIGIIKADITVDATGNADIVEFCGVKTWIGSNRDGNLQNYSQSVIERSGLDLDVINHCKYSEMLRGIYLAHTQYTLGDFSVMLTPRSTRCFDGDYKITLRDILTENHYDDCIAMAITDSDAHGALSSFIHYMGFMPYHDKIFTLEVPYRACIPRAFNRLLVSGRSLSASADAVSFFRMTADVINRGYAVGLAAGMAASTLKDVRDIDLNVLRHRLAELNIIPNVNDSKEAYNIHNILERVENGDEKALLEILCSDKEEVINYIRQRYELTKSYRLALTLGWFGCDDGSEQLKEKLNELLIKEKDEVYTDKHPLKPGNNKGGIIGDVDLYWEINRIITVLAILKDKNCVKTISKAVADADSGGSSERDVNEYVRGRIDLHRIPHFDRIRVLCFYVEQVPDKEFIKPLQDLLTKINIGNFVCTENIVGKNYQNAYVELSIIRALACCGCEEGIERLIAYIQDVHYIFSKNAHDELVAISGVDFGYDKNKWIEWLKNTYTFKMTPYEYDDNMF